MKKLLLILSFIIGIHTFGTGQKRWAVGISASIDKLVSNFNPNTSAKLQYGYGLQFNLFHEFNKKLFIKSGIGIYTLNFTSEETAYIGSNYVNGNVVTYYQTRTGSYTDGFLEIPISLGYQIPVYTSKIFFHGTLGISLAKEFFFNSSTQYSSNNSSNFYNQNSYYEQITFQSTHNLLNAIFSMGFGYPLSSNFLLYGGLNYRQQILDMIQGHFYQDNKIGSLGLQITTIYYLGKNHK